MFGGFLVGLDILAYLGFFVCLFLWFSLVLVCFFPYFRSLLAFPPVLSLVTSIEYLDEAFLLPRVPMFDTSSENTKVLKLLNEGRNTFYFIRFRNVAQ